MKKKALITGIGGQDGSYLAEFLLKKTILFMEYYPEDLALNFKHLGLKRYFQK